MRNREIEHARYTGWENVLAVYEEAVKLGLVIPCLCSKNLTTAARQEIIFQEMKRITRGYLELWYR